MLMKVYRFSKDPADPVGNFEHVKDTLNRMRERDCNKGTFGTLACVCGSYGMVGAAMLCGSAAVTTGAGIVKMIIPNSIYPIAASQLWENVFVPVPDSENGTFCGDSADMIVDELNKCTAAVIGCGLKVTHDTKRLTDEVVRRCERPLIIDADALNCISDHTEILKERTAPTIITPHPGEMSRLCVCTVPEIQSSRLETAESFAREYGCIVVLKGAGTVTTDGESTYLNPTRNGALAKGGSGDVLAGVIGALVCQGIEPLKAAAAGVYLHGCAANEAVDYISPPCVTGRDLIHEIKFIL